MTIPTKQRKITKSHSYYYNIYKYLKDIALNLNIMLFFDIYVHKSEGRLLISGGTM